MTKIRSAFYYILISFLTFPATIGAQEVVEEYNIKRLISSDIMEMFRQINQSIAIYDHMDGNRLLLVGDSTEVSHAIEQLEKLDRQQMMVTIEFMLVEYFHENDYSWGIDITNGTSGNFSNASLTPGVTGSSASFLYNAVTKLMPSFQFNLRALVNDDKAKVLTNPHLVVESGKEATLTIKDRRTIVLETATINGVTTSLQEIEAGIDIRIKPIPTHDSLVHLDIYGQISEFLPFSNSGQFQIEDNSISTSVDVRPGQTLILGGLIIEETNQSDGGVPVLKDIPLLGKLFQNTRETKNYVERVMYITPYLHPAGDVEHYEVIRKLSEFEQQVDTLITEDPAFLQYQTTGSMSRKQRKRLARKQKRNQK